MQIVVASPTKLDTLDDINENSKGLEFLLDRRLKVKIKRARLPLFKANNIDFLLHDRLLLTGKLNFTRGGPHLVLYHPAQILP